MKYGDPTYYQPKKEFTPTLYEAEYNTLTSMKDRCLNPKNHAYKDYGGRGIKICDRWLDKQDGLGNFIKDMGRRPNGYSLDRIDVNGNYCPENCRWADWRTQNNNTRANHLLTIDGRAQTVTQWAREKGISPPTLFSRLRYGWPIERLFEKPHRNKYN